MVRKVAISVQGSVGPSGMDSDAWRRILTNRTFGTHSSDLCQAIAEMTKKLCTKEIEDRTNLEAYMACRLIPIDKAPGVRPIGVGEVLRRIVGKTVMNVLKPDVMKTAGSMQLCAGQKAGS